MKFGFLVKFHTLKDDFRFESYDCFNKVKSQAEVKGSVSTRGYFFKISLEICQKVEINKNLWKN